MIDLGYDGQGNRPRIKKKGRTKQAVKDRLIRAVDDLEAGIETSGSYTVREAARDWLAHGTRDLDENTVETYRILIEGHLVPKLGVIKLKSLNAKQVDQWLDGLARTSRLPACTSCTAP